jgi:hypothetical protein
LPRSYLGIRNLGRVITRVQADFAVV